MEHDSVTSPKMVAEGPALKKSKSSTPTFTSTTTAAKIDFNGMQGVVNGTTSNGLEEDNGAGWTKIEKRKEKKEKKKLEASTGAVNGGTAKTSTVSIWTYLLLIFCLKQAVIAVYRSEVHVFKP